MAGEHHLEQLRAIDVAVDRDLKGKRNKLHTHNA